MKKFTVQVVLTLLLIHTIAAQAKNMVVLPTMVKNAFLKKYPDANIKTWHLKNNVYDVKYAENKRNHIAYFSPDGNWIKSETRFHFTYSLPSEVKKGLKGTSFGSWYFEKIKEVDSTNNHYFVFLADSYAPTPNNDLDFFKQYYLYFSPEGKLLKKTLLP